MKTRTLHTGLYQILVCCFIILFSGCASAMTERTYYDSLVIVDPDLSSVSDGRYTGECTLTPPWGVYVGQNHVEVEVVIAGHSYEDIIVKTESLKSHEHLQKMRGLILENQSLQIDALTGATSMTGKAYLKAIMAALD
jgi:uncharacterized protein with FMN-binding domain